jgi:hypothetical protein
MCLCDLVRVEISPSRKPRMFFNQEQKLGLQRAVTYAFCEMYRKARKNIKNFANSCIKCGRFNNCCESLYAIFKNCTERKITKELPIFSPVLRSRSRKEPYNFGGSGAVTRCGSGSKLDVKHRWINKNVTNSNSFLLFLFIFTTM